ncbi:MAG TPA: SGNH/GDSL hydrolase family protein [Propylenella sp.]
MKTVLCFGDSNTWGSATDSRPSANEDARYAADERWPGIMQRELGADWAVIEEGLPGRTTVHPDPVEGSWMDGSAYLLPCLRSHRPIDLIVIMLGTNDLKMRFGVPAGDIAGGVEALLKIVERSESGPHGKSPPALVVCPPPILDHHGARPDLADMFLGGYEKSLRLTPLYAEVAERHSAAFLDAGALIRSSDHDGIHLDLEAHAVLGRAVAQAVRTLGC